MASETHQEKHRRMEAKRCAGSPKNGRCSATKRQRGNPKPDPQEDQTQAAPSQATRGTSRAQPGDEGKRAAPSNDEDPPPPRPDPEESARHKPDTSRTQPGDKGISSRAQPGNEGISSRAQRGAMSQTERVGEPSPGTPNRLVSIHRVGLAASGLQPRENSVE